MNHCRSRTSRLSFIYLSVVGEEQREPGGGRLPSRSEVDACRRHSLSAIPLSDPPVISRLFPNSPFSLSSPKFLNRYGVERSRIEVINGRESDENHPLSYYLAGGRQLEKKFNRVRVGDGAGRTSADLSHRLLSRGGRLPTLRPGSDGKGVKTFNRSNQIGTPRLY